MTYRELINAIAINVHKPTREVENFLDAYRDELTIALKRGDIVNHKNLAVFYTGKRTARIGRNPRTGLPIQIRAKKLFTARFSRAAHESLN